MQLNRKLIILLAFFSLLVCVITLQDTYAKYISKADTSSSLTISRWKILVNDIDVRQSLTSNALITPVFSGNEHINPNVVAPTSEGYFDLVINGTDTDVSFDYTITVTKKDGSPVDDLKVVSYTKDGITTDVEDDITGTVYLSDTNKIHDIRVNLKWVDDETQTMDNALDTNTTLASITELNVNVNFIQKTTVVAQS